VDPTNSKRLYISAPLRPERFVQRSNDGGHHWKTILNVTAFDDEDYNLAYAVQKSFVMDPSNGKRLLVGTNKVFETKNARTGTPTWNAISHILSPSGDVANQYITTLAIAPSDAKTVYAATSDGHLWITTNGGTKWKRRDNGLFGAGGTVLDIRIDPGNASHGYAVSAYTAGVWELNQTGSTFQWTNISGDLPTNVSGLCIAVDWRYSIPALYVGTTRGVYHSVNNGGQWKIFGADLPNTMVMDLETLDAKHVLAAATFGRGTWEILISPSRISGRVFEDLDGNGVHDPNDPGMEGVIVFLDVSGNNRLEKFQFRTTTGAAGHYVFDSVPPGKYAVRQIVPNAFVQTTVNPQRIRVGGSQVEGQNFGNQPMKAGIGSKEFLHRAQLHYLPGRQIGQAIGAKGEFARSMQAGRKRRDMRHA